jgi:hypothetical protein
VPWRSPPRRPRAPSLRFKLSEAATIHVTVGGKTLVKRLDAGKESVGLGSLLKKAGRLHRGRVSFAITATDAAGNTSAARLAKLSLR